MAISLCLCVFTCLSSHKNTSHIGLRDHPSPPYNTFSLFFFFFKLQYVACAILVSQPGIELMTPIVKACSLNHWTPGKSQRQLLKSWMQVPRRQAGVWNPGQPAWLEIHTLRSLGLGREFKASGCKNHVGSERRLKKESESGSWVWETHDSSRWRLKILGRAICLKI